MAQTSHDAMHDKTETSDNQAAMARAELLRESGVHKLVIADRDGNCLAYLLAWNSFDYDPETDTHVCVANPEGKELMILYTAGDIRPAPGVNTYVVTAPEAHTAHEMDYRAAYLAR